MRNAADATSERLARYTLDVQVIWHHTIHTVPSFCEHERRARVDKKGDSGAATFACILLTRNGLVVRGSHSPNTHVPRSYIDTFY
jgi:hypothetical protein